MTRVGNYTGGFMRRDLLSPRLGGRLVLLASCLIFLLTAGSSAAAEDPRELVLEIGEAVDNSDAAGFARLVDMDAVLNSAIDAFVKDASKPENAARVPPAVALLLSRLLSGGSQGARGMLIGEIKNFVLAGVSSGAFAGRKPDKKNFKGALAPLFADASLGRKEIKDIGTPRPSGSGWIVPFVTRDHGNGNEYRVQARVEPASEGLKLTGVENMLQLIRQIGEESEAAR